MGTGRGRLKRTITVSTVIGEGSPLHKRSRAGMSARIVNVIGWRGGCVDPEKPWTMARTHTLLTIALVTLTGTQRTSAQTMLTEASVWSEQRSRVENAVEHHHLTYRYHITGDTTIQAQSYYLLRQTGVDSIFADGQSTTEEPINMYAGALREDATTARWYIVLPDFDNETLLYDFSLALGDPIEGTYGDCSAHPAVIAIDTVQIGDTQRRRYHTDLNDSYIIEGVGANTGLLGQLCPALEGSSCLLVYHQGNDSLVVDGCAVNTTGIAENTAGRPLVVYPNPTTSTCMVGSAWRGHPVLISDALGRSIGGLRIDATGMLDLSDLDAGSYFLTVSGRTVRVLKQ